MRGRQWALAATGLASIGMYWLAFARPYPLVEWWQYAISDYGTISEYSLNAQILFVGAFVVLFGLYYLALNLTRTVQTNALPVIVAVQAVAGLVMVAMYPVTALDIYDYVLYARLGLYWGANPLVQTPAMFPDEPTLGFSYWPNEPSVYGPLWQALSERVIGLVDGQVLEGMVAFKVLALVASIGTTVLIWLALRQLWPRFAVAGALIWAWNPLQVFETAGNAHNDALMVLLLVGALLCLVHGFDALPLPMLTAGLLIKVTLAPLGPLFAVLPLLGRGSVGRRVASLVGAVMLSVVLVVVAYRPYWDGRASLPFLDRGNWFTASPATLLRQLLRQSLEFEVAGQRAAIVCAVAFALTSAVILGRLAVRHWRHADSALAPDAIRAAYHIFFAYLVVACLWWQPWYLLVLLAIAALSGDLELVHRTNLFCFGGLLSYVVFKYIWQIHQTDWQLDYTSIMALSVLVIFPLPLLHLAWSHRHTRPHAVVTGQRLYPPRAS